jgi:hypothetical protein
MRLFPRRHSVTPEFQGIDKRYNHAGKRIEVTGLASMLVNLVADLER